MVQVLSLVAIIVYFNHLLNVVLGLSVLLPFPILKYPSYRLAESIRVLHNYKHLGSISAIV